MSHSGYSLIDIRFANDTFGWAVGGELDAIEPKAWFLETSDGGKTWCDDAWLFIFLRSSLVHRLSAHRHVLTRPHCLFLHCSTDRDAQKHELPGFYALGLDVVDNKVAYAAVDNLITQQSGLAKYLGTF